MRVLYCSGPYAATTPQGILHNIQKAMAMGYAIRRLGLVPFVPHHAILPLKNYALAISERLAFISRADGVPGWQASPDAIREYEHALTLQKPVFHSLSEVEEYIR